MSKPDEDTHTVYCLRRVASARTPADRREWLVELDRLLHPQSDRSDNLLEVAERMEGAIRSTVASLEYFPYRAAAEILLVLTPGEVNLTARRRRASEELGISSDSFRRRHEVEILQEVALRLRAGPAPIGETTGHVGDGTVPIPAGCSPLEMELAAQFLRSAEEAVLLVGSVLLVKIADRVAGKTLSPGDVQNLRCHQSHLLADPHQALQFLCKTDRAPNSPAVTGGSLTARQSGEDSS